MVGHEFAVAFIFLEVGIFWIKYLIAELGDKFLEQTTSIDSFFNLSMLVDKLNLPLGSWILLHHEYFIKTIFQNIGSINRNWVPSMKFFSLHRYEVLEDLSSQSKRYRMRKIHQQSGVDSFGNLRVVQTFKLFTHVFLYNPEVFTVNLESLISIVQSGDGIL